MRSEMQRGILGWRGGVQVPLEFSRIYYLLRSASPEMQLINVSSIIAVAEGNKGMRASQVLEGSETMFVTVR